MEEFESWLRENDKYSDRLNNLYKLGIINVAGFDINNWME